MNELGLEDEFVSDRLGTTHRAIDVFRTGEFQGTHNERLRIIKLLEKHVWFSRDDRDEVLGILDGTYECKCSGCIALIKGETE